MGTSSTEKAEKHSEKQAKCPIIGKKAITLNKAYLQDAKSLAMLKTRSTRKQNKMAERDIRNMPRPKQSTHTKV